MSPQIAPEWDPIHNISPQEFQRLLDSVLPPPPPAPQYPPPSHPILTPELREQVRAQTGYLPTPTQPYYQGQPLGAATLPAKVSPSSTINWFFVRRRNEYPGNHPDYGVLRQLGMTGIMTEVDDPFLPSGMAQDRANGFAVGVWIDPGKYPTPQDAANDLKVKLAGQNPDAIALDPETGDKAKGFPGSPQWHYSELLAEAFAGSFPGIYIFATPIPLQDDFNYKAYLDRGQDIWVQTYGSDVTKLFDPHTVVQRVIDNGVPVSRIGALISPLQIPTAPPVLQAMGVTKIAVYTSDHLDAGVIAAAAPFPPSGSLPSPGSAPTYPQAPPAAPEETPTEEIPSEEVPDVDYTTPLFPEIVALLAAESVEEDDNPDYDEDEADESDFPIAADWLNEDLEPDEAESSLLPPTRVFEPI